jgi:hypothetical protein
VEFGAAPKHTEQPESLTDESNPGFLGNGWRESSGLDSDRYVCLHTINNMIQMTWIFQSAASYRQVALVGIHSE